MKFARKRIYGHFYPVRFLKTLQEAHMEIVLASAILAEVLLGMFFTRRAASLQEEVY